MNRRQIVFNDIPFAEALKRASAFKRPCRFFSGVSWDLTSDNYEPISEIAAARLAEQPGTMVIFSHPVGGRGPEIVVQDR